MVLTWSEPEPEPEPESCTYPEMVSLLDVDINVVILVVF